MTQVHRDARVRLGAECGLHGPDDGLFPAAAAGIEDESDDDRQPEGHECRGAAHPVEDLLHPVELTAGDGADPGDGSIPGAGDERDHQEHAPRRDAEHAGEGRHHGADAGEEPGDEEAEDTEAQVVALDDRDRLWGHQAAHHRELEETAARAAYQAIDEHRAGGIERPRDRKTKSGRVVP